MNLQLSNFPAVETETAGPRRSRAVEILLAALKSTQALDLNAMRVYVRDRALEDGAKHHRESETVVIELERRDLWHLFEHVSPDRKSPVTLIQVLGHTVETIRDRARDSLDGPGERNVQVHYSECVFGHLLNIRIAGGQAEAEIEFVAEFESFLIGSEQ